MDKSINRNIIGELNLNLITLDFENKKNLKDKHIKLINMFDSGNKSINTKLKEDAFNLYENGYGNTYLLIDMDRDQLVSFVILKSTAMVKYSEGVSKYHLEPALEIDTFAVDKKYQKKYQTKEDSINGYSISYLVFVEIMKLIRKIAEEIIGIRYVIVLSVPDAVSFYEKQGFTLLTDEKINNTVTPEKMADIFVSGCEYMYYFLWF